MEALGLIPIDDWGTNGSPRRFELKALDRVFILAINRPPPNSPESRCIATFQLTGTISDFFTITIDLEDDLGRLYLIKRVEAKKSETRTLELLGSFTWVRLKRKTLQLAWKITQEVKSIPVPSCVGLRNDENSLCYMNAILQLLYHIPLFANAIFEGAVRGKGLVDEKCDVVLQLARLFAQMSQNGRESLNTRNLTKSFGWNKNQRKAFRDPHEFLDVLLGRLDALLVERGCESLKPLYEGVRSIIRTEDGKVVRHENFCDISISVGVDTFGKGIDVALNGKDNSPIKFQIEKAPPLLFFQVFASTRQLGSSGIPKHLNMEQWCRCDGEKMYELFAVVQHTGNDMTAHYYLSMRTTVLDDWTYFNDTAISPKYDEAAVLQYDKAGQTRSVGGRVIKRSRSEAFQCKLILMYIRRDMVDKMMQTPLDIPDQFKSSATGKVEKPTGGQTFGFRVLTEESIQDAITFMRMKDLRQHSSKQKLPRSSSLQSAYEAMSNTFHRDMKTVKIWKCGGNGPFPDRMMSDSNDIKVETLSKQESLIFLEESLSDEVRTKGDVLFVWECDPRDQEKKERFLQLVHCEADKPVSSIEPAVRGMLAGRMRPDDELLFFVHKGKYLQALDMDRSIHDQQITGWPIFVQIVNDEIRKCNFSVPQDSETATGYVPVPNIDRPFSAEFYLRMREPVRFVFKGFDEQKDFKMMPPATLPLSILGPAVIQQLGKIPTDYKALFFMSLAGSPPTAKPISLPKSGLIRDIFRPAEAEYVLYYHVVPNKMYSYRVTMTVTPNSGVPDQMHQLDTPGPASVRELCEMVGVTELDKYRHLLIHEGKLQNSVEPSDPLKDLVHLHIERLPEAMPPNTVRMQVVYACEERSGKARLFGQPFWILVQENESQEQVCSDVAKSVEWLKAQYDLVVTNSLLERDSQYSLADIYSAAKHGRLLCVLVHRDDKALSPMLSVIRALLREIEIFN